MGSSDTVITLKGSVEIVSEFFFTAINSILYQRGALRKFSTAPPRGPRASSSSRPSHSIVHMSLTQSFLFSPPSSAGPGTLAGIYQPETFKRESKYGLTVLTTTDQGLLAYLGSVMSQMESWLTDGDVQRLVVVVSGIDSGETLERWQFNVCVEDGNGVEVTVAAGNDENVSHNVSKRSSGGEKAKGGSRGSKTVKEVHDEIQAIIRQITASVSVHWTWRAELASFR